MKGAIVQLLAAVIALTVIGCGGDVEEQPSSDARTPCDAPETKCTTADGSRGWCERWDWPDGDQPEALYCKASESISDPACNDAPACSPVGSACQSKPGEGGCPSWCCSIAY